ncbi:MAG: hypothetical protein JWO35_246 [Candidatus Saccharibacteria bacterium]|nr:hypothetical protein [Candidatus Saccharibacteria bacterium]
MPRKDGLPTNQEMLVDFNSTAHEVFINTYERSVADRLPPALEGKPLHAMEIRFSKRHAPDPNKSNDTIQERLVISPLGEKHGEHLRDNISFRTLPEDIIERYNTMGDEIAKVIIFGGLAIRDLLPAEAIEASYNMDFGNGARGRHVSTFKEKPSKQSIAAGKYFAEEMLEYSTSPFFDFAADDKKVLEFLGSTSPGMQTHHGITFRMYPGLPLNGHESTQFLRHFIRTMTRKHTISTGHIESLETTGAPESFIDTSRQLQEAAAVAIKRAQDILDKKA